MAIAERIGVREAKNSFSALAAQVNETGHEVTVCKNGRPWVTIAPASGDAAERRRNKVLLNRLTRLIEADASAESAWPEATSDRELLGREWMRRFG